MSEYDNSYRAESERSSLKGVIGKLLLGAGLAVGATGVAYTAHVAHELHNLETSIDLDPLGLERTVDTKPVFDGPVIPLSTEMPSADVTPEENPFLDGINS